MTKEESNNLRKRAEAKLGFVNEDISSMSEDAIRKTLQELHTHQIELEMQNEELRISQFNLNESRQQYSDLYDFAPIGYFTVDDKGLIITANLIASIMLGVERNLLLKQPLTAFILGEDQDIYYKHRKVLIETKGKRTCELRLQNKEGNLFYVQLESVVVPNLDGKEVHFRTTITDCSERKQLERKLKASEELHRITIENISDPVFITDEAGIFTFICPNIPHILGYSVKEVEGMGNISAFVGDNLFHLSNLIKQGEISNIETVITDKNGSKRDYLVTVKMVSIKKGTILYVCREFTDQKKIEQEKDKLILDLQTAIQKVKQLSGLVPICSHCKNIRDDKG